MNLQVCPTSMMIPISFSIHLFKKSLNDLIFTFPGTNGITLSTFGYYRKRSTCYAALTIEVALTMKFPQQLNLILSTMIVATPATPMAPINPTHSSLKNFQKQMGKNSPITNFFKPMAEATCKSTHSKTPQSLTGITQEATSFPWQQELIMRTTTITTMATMHPKQSNKETDDLLAAMVTATNTTAMAIQGKCQQQTPKRQNQHSTHGRQWGLEQKQLLEQTPLSHPYLKTSLCSPEVIFAGGIPEI